MFDTMTMTKVLGAVCGSLLVFLLGSWAADEIYKMGGGHGEGEEHAQSYTIDTGASEEAAPAEEAAVDVLALVAASDPAAGEKVFAKCKACHKIDGTDGTGPHLNGILDRAKAASPGFGYSDVLMGMASETWSAENLYAFIQNPKGYAPGTKMSFAGLAKPEELGNLIAYLGSLK